MSTNIRQLIRNLNSGKNLDKDLPVYINELAGQYNKYALIQSTMQYYVICEQYAEGFFKEKEVIETVDFINGMMKEIFLGGYESDRESCIQRIDAERTKVIRKMEVLTNYTDQLMIYEYMLNRLEHKFDEETSFEEDDTVFAQQLLQYIMQVKDSYIVNEKIKDVIGQLPVRMARSKFFELIKNSISLYKGSEKESLDGYLYMLRTSASLYKPEADGVYFKGWDAFVEKLKSADFDSLNESEFTELFDELKTKAKDISDASEVFVTLQELINSLYVYLLIKPWEEETVDENSDVCVQIIRCIASQAGKQDGEMAAADSVEGLERLEGVPEKIMTDIQQLMGSFDMAKESYTEQIEKLSISKEFADVEKAGDLLSSSLFIEFDEKSKEDVTDKMAEEETIRLVEQFAELFHDNSIRFVRAVIACVISRMPVFFANVEEIQEYIQTSLYQCKDLAEKEASYELLKGMMEEDK